MKTNSVLVACASIVMALVPVYSRKISQGKPSLVSTQPEEPQCECPSFLCRRGDWGPWTSCYPCFKGIQKRCKKKTSGIACNKCEIHKTEVRNCDTVCFNGGSLNSGNCQCGTGSKGKCCECAAPAFCRTEPGNYSCEGSCQSEHECQDSRCTLCINKYYLKHDTGKCIECNVPQYCNASDSDGLGAYWCDEKDANSHCKPPSSCCRKCQYKTPSGDAYHLDTNNTNQCWPKCNWLGHYCWPGTCDANNYSLATTCNCTKGFKMVVTDKTTTCELNHFADIQTCIITAVSSLGEIAESKIKGNITNCASTVDGHINFVLKNMTFNFSTSFKLPEDPPSGNKTHLYVKRSAYGVTYVTINVGIYQENGTYVNILDHDLDAIGQDICNIGNFSANSPETRLITCEHQYSIDYNNEINDGQRVCNRFEVGASGYVDIQDMFNLSTPPNRKYYDTLTSKKEICFNIDLVPPDHCVKKGCLEDLLNLGYRVRTDRELNISFYGWFDPQPQSIVGNSSGISGYEIEVRDVIYTSKELYADFKAISLIPTKGEYINISLPYRKEASMFAIYLWVLDSTQESPNYRVARRFVLVDDNSTIATNTKYPIVITTASRKSDYQWQVNLSPIEINWHNHFYNTWHVHTNLLLPIRQEGNLSISGPFEQETGELPISGTPNNNGVTQYFYRYHHISNTTEEISNWTFAIDGLNETETLIEIIPLDGDWVNITIKAIDIMNNTVDDYVIVKVDSTPPSLKDMYIRKDGYQVLVHNKTDLTAMDMKFQAYDLHSGMERILWKLGTEHGTNDIGSGFEPVVKPNFLRNCSSCYCPVVHDSQCEAYNYTVPLGGLIGNKSHGQHNRKYHFTFSVTNNAKLKTTKHVVVLIDLSPPEPGHVFDGKQGEKDRDFQSDSLLSWYWTGFIDHESGISKYHIAIGEKCFTTEQLQFLHIKNENISGLQHFEVLNKTFYNYVAVNTGFYRISVIAFNNAMDPSPVVCSTGIVYDNTPPKMYDVLLIGGIHQKSIICQNNTSWFLRDDGILFELYSVDECDNRCINNNYHLDIKFPKVYLNNESVHNYISKIDSRKFCNLFPSYSTDRPIFIHSDNIHFTWKTEEPESQMNDYYLAISSSPYLLDTSDVIGAISTHNRTDFKCINCGLSQGELYYARMMAQNKAGLTETITIGPIIMDVTPPEYIGGLVVNMTSTDAILSWDATSFQDTDYNVVLTEYEWSLGSDAWQEAVVPFTKYIVPYDTVNTSMEITCAIGVIQAHDQEKGKEYYFTLKAYDKANLYHLESTSTFVTSSKIQPSAGLALNVDSKKQEIGFQEDTNILCVKWMGFYHPSEEFTYSISIGSRPMLDDIETVHNVQSTGFHCISNLTLELNRQYYATVTGITQYHHQQVNATSKGIYITSLDRLFEKSMINLHGDCPSQFKHTPDSYAFKTNNTLIYHVYIPQTSKVYLTLKIGIDMNETEGIDFLNEMIVQYQNDQLIATFCEWVNGSKLMIYYQFVQLSDNIKITIDINTSSIIINAVKLDNCQITRSIQPRIDSIDVKWFFMQPHIAYIDKYDISVKKNRLHPDYEEILLKKMVRSENNKTLQVKLTQGQTYSVCLQPCFKNTCVSKKICKDFSVDLYEPKVRSLNASVDVIDQIRDSNYYYLNAKWDAFEQKELNGRTAIQAYDWTVALDQSAAGLLLPWKRITIENQAVIAVNETTYLHAQKYRSMFFIVRCMGDNGLLTMVASLMRLLDLNPPSGVQVFDLPPDYDLDMIKDSLGSSNIGILNRDLYDSDIDFTPNTEKISGALLGISCSHYIWTLQLNIQGDCTKHESVNCLSIKETNENVITFTRQKLEYTKNYTICVSGGVSCPKFWSCSNGFVVDIEPPLPGNVILGYDLKNYSTDSTTVSISWSGFSDIEQYVDIAYFHGIKQYTLCIGSVPYGNDILAFKDVGISNHYIETELPLHNGRLYYATIKACDHVDMCMEVSSNRLLVDSTPPYIAPVHVYHTNVFNGDEHGLFISWDSIEDPESGIAKVEVSISSNEYGEDVMSFVEVHNNNVILERQDMLLDGHSYFINVKATNKVNLWETRSSSPILYDASPPQVGFIRHGIHGEITSRFTKDDSAIKCHWGGFSDPDSGLFYYRVAVGFKPYTDDVISWRDMGMKTEFHLNEITLLHGRGHFITVEACNSVLLCSQTVSTALIADNTAPIPGQVHVGNSYDHEQYIYHSTSVSIRWIGFQDLQSDIAEFYWCISTLNGECDVLPLKSAHKSTHIMEPNTYLPTNTVLMASVTAVNNVNMSISSTSKSFIIDATPPEIIEPVELTTKSSLKNRTQFDRSYISLKWKMTDHESPMAGYIVAIHAHHDGISPLMIDVGDISQVTLPFTEDKLKDGNIYTIKVTGCNAAQMCVSYLYDDLMVDSTPPLIGGFIEPMFWNATARGMILTLAWQGFDDPHSGIAGYYVTISSSYSGNDLSGGILYFEHDDSNRTQTHEIELMSDVLSKAEIIYLTIMCENKVGLKSDAAKASVYILDRGRLDIQNHSCDIHYCNNDCTCAVLYESCNNIGEQYDCQYVNGTGSDQKLKVYNGINNEPITLSPSSVCLSAFWTSDYSVNEVKRYEWSVSVLGQPPGFGLDDLTLYQLFDVELYDSAVFCTKGDSYLDGSYIYHVNAWHNFSEYTHYTSMSVTLDPTPPYIMYGKNVIDLDASMEEELHYTTDISGIYSSWENVFMDPESAIKYYMVAIGTSPSGNEIYGPVNVGLETNISYTDITLQSGFHYYTTVYAYNNVDMVERTSSKGFVVDLEKPYCGYVFTGPNYTDIVYQIGDELMFSWYGFIDQHSYIKWYHYALVKSQLELKDAIFNSVFLQNQLSIPGSYEHGEMYVIYIKATDAAGHDSDIVKSNTVTIDKTPPEMLQCNTISEMYSRNMKCNCSEGNTNIRPCMCEPLRHVSVVTGFIYQVKIVAAYKIEMKSRLQLSDVEDWVFFERINNNSYEHVTYYIPKNDEKLIPTLYTTEDIENEISLTISKCNQNKTDFTIEHDMKIIRQCSKFILHISFPFYDSESDINSVQLGMGTNPGGFQLLSLSDIGTAYSFTKLYQLQHQMNIYTTIIVSNKAGLKENFILEPFLVDWTPPEVNNLIVIADQGNPLKVQALWTVYENESVATDCMWAIGFNTRTDDILEWCATDMLSSSICFLNNISHGDIIYTSLKCYNNLDMCSEIVTIETMVLMESPHSNTVNIDVYPQQHTMYSPKENTQFSQGELEFAHHGFTDVNLIQHYEYKIQGYDNDKWINFEKQDYVYIDDITMDSSEFDIQLRAVNSKGLYSTDVESKLFINKEKPQLTGQRIVVSLNNYTLSLNWGNIFYWDDTSGDVVYDVNIGSQECASDLMKVAGTRNTSVILASKKFKHPMTCFCVVTAVVRSGMYESYMEQINIE